jgi:hypothetical protein
VIAEKEGYVVTPLPNQKENFNAHKLAEIIVTVIDEDDNQPLKVPLKNIYTFLDCSLSLKTG